MTREDIEKKMHEAAEEIKPLVTTLVEALCEAHQKGYLAGFELGAKMTYPHWIPVEEERPKFDWKDDGSWSSSLPILIYSIHGISIGTFQLDHMTGKSYWFFDGSKHEEFAGEWRIITHWMPLPQPPRKEEK